MQANDLDHERHRVNVDNGTSTFHYLVASLCCRQKQS
jgi:hypothetical protein